MYEQRTQKLIPRSKFLSRLTFHAGLSVLIVSASLGLGIIGYRQTEGLPWLDSLLNAAMILGGILNQIFPLIASIRVETLLRLRLFPQNFIDQLQWNRMFRKSKVLMIPFILLVSTVSPILKGLLNANNTPARKFSPISLNANPIGTIVLFPFFEYYPDLPPIIVPLEKSGF